MRVKKKRKLTFYDSLNITKEASKNLENDLICIINIILLIIFYQ